MIFTFGKRFIKIIDTDSGNTVANTRGHFKCSVSSYENVNEETT